MKQGIRPALISATDRGSRIAGGRAVDRGLARSRVRAGLCRPEAARSGNPTGPARGPGHRAPRGRLFLVTAPASATRVGGWAAVGSWARTCRADWPPKHASAASRLACQAAAASSHSARSNGARRELPTGCPVSRSHAASASRVSTRPSLASRSLAHRAAGSSPVMPGTVPRAETSARSAPGPASDSASHAGLQSWLVQGCPVRGDETGTDSGDDVP